MKRPALIFISTAFVYLMSFSQSCLPDGIFFNQQDQIDNFQAEYPGCTEILGDVSINGSNITNLNGLLVLDSIGGDLSITSNDILTTLTGLDSLNSIGGDLNIGCSIYYGTGNPLLINFTGLSSLTSIGGTFSICSNNSLKNMNGLENLMTAGEIKIINNDSLMSLSGLQSLTNIDNDLSISGNDTLTNLNGINNLTYAGTINLNTNANLTSLSGLESVSSIGGDLDISHNPLTTLQSLNSLNAIGGDLTIDNNYYLSSLSGLENLTEVDGGIIITGNISLTDITSLSNVNLVGGDLIITGNEITSLTPLSGITSIGGILEISGNINQTSLAGIDNINPASIQGLRIHGLVNLTDCAFENICEYLSNPNGVVDIYWNYYPCNNPSQVANDCGIILTCLPYGNYYFLDQADIDNFQSNYPGCTNLKGSVHIWEAGSNSITNLEGLNVITSIDGMLSVFGTNNLTSLSGLDNIEATSISGLFIDENDALSECDIKSVCDYISEPNGELEILYNASGCNSVEEIQNACETIFIPEQGLEPLIKVYPSPTNQWLYLENNSGYELKKLKVFNNFGQLVISMEFIGHALDVSSLNSGVYILELIFNDNISRLKFLINK